MKSQMHTKAQLNNELSIYDIYVLNEGGIPIFAGCSSTDYCADHEGQHPLHAGFMHAMRNFGNEVFSSEIRNLRFETVKVNFITENQYMIVFVNPLETEDHIIQKKIELVSSLFRNKYAGEVQAHNLSDKLYEEFMDDIDELGLIAKSKFKSTKNIFVGSSEEKEMEKQGLFSRFKQKFRDFVLS